MSEPWYARHARRLELEQRARRAWVNELAARWQLIRMAGSLTPPELAEQTERNNLLLGRTFLTITPKGYRITMDRLGQLWLYYPAGDALSDP